MSSNSKSNTDIYGEFEYTKSCSCSCENYVCKKIYHETVPISNGFVSGTVQTLSFLSKVFTLGIAANCNGGIKDYVHDIIEVKIKCKKCGKEFYWTTDFYDDYNGTIKNRFGQYRKYEEIVKSADINVSFTDARLALPRYKTYSLVNYNCGHYAHEAYNLIKYPYSSSYYSSNKRNYKVEDGFYETKLVAK